jgi:hypothetical protein
MHSTADQSPVGHRRRSADDRIGVLSADPRLVASLTLEIAMLYSRPGVESALQRLRDTGAR